MASNVEHERERERVEDRADEVIAMLKTQDGILNDPLFAHDKLGISLVYAYTQLIESLNDILMANSIFSRLRNAADPQSECYLQGLLTGLWVATRSPNLSDMILESSKETEPMLVADVTASILEVVYDKLTSTSTSKSTSTST